MNVKVKIPSQMRQFTGGNSEVEVSGVETVKELLESMRANHADLVERVLDEQGEIRPFLNVYVGDEDVRFLQGLETKLDDSAQVSILPQVAGGR